MIIEIKCGNKLQTVTLKKFQLPSGGLFFFYKQDSLLKSWRKFLLLAVYALKDPQFQWSMYQKKDLSYNQSYEIETYSSISAGICLF